MIKVCGGKYRSRNLETPLEGTEPTKNRVREALFSAICPNVPDARCLDLFAGSGALGIEALSRGASFCYFNDLSKTTAQLIERNLNTLKEAKAKVLNLPYMAALESLKGESFGVVFLDPPYAMVESYQEVLSFLLRNDMIDAGSAIVMEHRGKIDVDTSRFESVREYHYGNSDVTILRGLRK